MWTAGKNVKLVATMENDMEFPKKLDTELPYDPVTPLLGIYTKDMKVENWTSICIAIFTAELAAKRWKQPKHPLTDEQIKKMWYTHAIEYQNLKQTNEKEY